MAARRSYGTGSLWQRKDAAGRLTWYCKFSVDGKTKKRAIGPVREPGTTIGLTKPQAEKRLRQLMDDGVAATPNDVLNVFELARRYARELIARGKKESYVEGPFWSGVNTWLAPFFGDTPVHKITGEMIKDLVALMRQGERPDGRKVRPLSNKTICNHVWSTLSSMLTYAREEGWIVHNPFLGLRAPTFEHGGEIKFFEPDEIEALVRSVKPGDWAELDAALYLVAAKTGLRLGELIGLRWQDVDWKAGRIRVVQSWSPHVKKFTTPKSVKSRRSLPMADEVGGVLDRQHQRSSHQGPNDLVFADPATGGPLNANHVRPRFKWALEEAGLPITHTFHHLRHTFGTRMAAVGAPMRTLQHWMGHKNITTTQRYADYAPAPEHERELVAMAFRLEGVAPTHEVSAAAVAAWVLENRPDVYSEAQYALTAA